MSDALDFLYPPIEPFAHGLLDVGDGHRVYWEQSGNPDGQPVLLLHGGPGAPSRPVHRRWFDPAFWRFVTLHQRGCGLSTPLAETRANTTGHLIADIEALRARLAIERWLAFGGSWGTSLALAYGEAHPAAVTGFILSGVAFCDEDDREFWWNGARMLFPEAFDRLLDVLPASRRHDAMHALYALTMDPDPDVHLPAARALCLYSGATVGTVPSAEMLAQYDDPRVTLPLARLALHYQVNAHFLQSGQLLAGVGTLVDKPCAILAGRYDVTTPADRGWRLHKAWPGSIFHVIEGGAHTISEPASARVLLETVEAAKTWPC